MNALRHLLCQWFGYCPCTYSRDADELVKRYNQIENRVDNLYWKPRDLLDIR